MYTSYRVPSLIPGLTGGTHGDGAAPALITAEYNLAAATSGSLGRCVHKLKELQKSWCGDVVHPPWFVTDAGKVESIAMFDIMYKKKPGETLEAGPHYSGPHYLRIPRFTSVSNCFEHEPFRQCIRYLHARDPRRC